MSNSAHHYYGYTRVSTAKQGEKGVSLQEQKDAIARYAVKNSLTILGWFEERETAAKRGRPVFGKMMKLLRQRKAQGVIIHKIDRSARNLKDWSDLGELIDQGVEIHFANESLDMNSRGGRLSADIQAVIAADFIRNLREEVKKGMMGRLKQGLYPLRAPYGYLDQGKGKPKIVDPVRGPLIKQAFELYGSGQYNQYDLAEVLYRRGLRTFGGKRVNDKRISFILNNNFYAGIVQFRNSALYEGVHEPLVSKALFERVQRILKGKLNARAHRHDFTYRRLLKCAHCRMSLIGERQKGIHYYRCHTRGCVTKCIRETDVDETMQRTLGPVRFSEEETQYFATKVTAMREDWTNLKEQEEAALRLQQSNYKERLARLTDAFLDGSIDKEAHDERRMAHFAEKERIENRLADLQRGEGQTVDHLSNFLELAQSLDLSLEMATGEEKREMVQIATSNRWVDGKNVVVELSEPFAVLAERAETKDGAPSRGIPRTADTMISKLMDWFATRGFELPWKMRLGSLNTISDSDEPDESAQPQDVVRIANTNERKNFGYRKNSVNIAAA